MKTLKTRSSKFIFVCWEPPGLYVLGRTAVRNKHMCVRPCCWLTKDGEVYKRLNKPKWDIILNNKTDDTKHLWDLESAVLKEARYFDSIEDAELFLSALTL